MHPNTKSISESGRFLWHVIVGSSAQSDLVCTQMDIRNVDFDLDLSNYLALITQHIQNQSGSVNKSVSFYSGSRNSSVFIFGLTLRATRVYFQMGDAQTVLTKERITWKYLF